MNFEEAMTAALAGATVSRPGKKKPKDFRDLAKQVIFDAEGVFLVLLGGEKIWSVYFEQEYPEDLVANDWTLED